MSRIITPKFRVSYPHLFTPRKANEKSEPKYSITALFTDDPVVPPGSGTLDEMKRLALQAAFDKWGETEDTKKKIKSGKIRMPFLTPDEGQYPDEFTVMIRLSASEDFKPGVVDRFKGSDGKPRVITDPGEVYPGCWARASVRAFAYSNSGNNGVSFGLNNVQKLGDDTRFDSRKAAQDDFEAEESDAGVSGDDLDDMLG